MPIVSLTDASLRNLKSGARATYFDASLRGFGVRVTPSGVKTFVIVYGSEKARRWETIGRYPLLSLAKARKEAADRLAAIRLGVRPETRLTFEEAFARFEQTHATANRDSTAKETRRLVQKHFMPRFHARPLSGISTEDLTAIIDKLLPTPSEALHAYAAARVVFRWAARRRLIERSPIDGLPPPSKPVPRERVLRDEELRAVLRAADDGSTFGTIIRLLILTGQPKGQIASLRREFIDEENGLITWPSEMMKGNRRHSIPLTEQVAAILSALPREGYLLRARGRDTPFNGFAKCKQAFDAGLEDVAQYIIHDLRRTFASGLQSLGIPITHTEALLGHRSGSFAGIVSVYQRHSYIPEMREALDKWESHLAALLRRE